MSPFGNQIHLYNLPRGMHAKKRKNSLFLILQQLFQPEHFIPVLCCLNKI